MSYEEDIKTRTHDLSIFVFSKTVLTDLHGPFSKSMVFLIRPAFLSKRTGA